MRTLRILIFNNGHNLVPFVKPKDPMAYWAVRTHVQVDFLKKVSFSLEFLSFSGSVSHQLIRPPIFLQTLHPNHISISDYHSEFLSVPTGGAGTNSSSFFPDVRACSFSHDLGPCQDDQVVSCFL